LATDRDRERVVLRAKGQATIRAAIALFVFTASAAGPTVSFASAGSLPDGRAFEVVTPLEKNGGDVIADSQRTRAAADGSAIGFVSLSGFGDVHGTGVATEYISRRSTSPTPGDNGWSTHGITPLQGSIPLPALEAGMEPFYSGEMSNNLDAGVFFAYSPLTNDPGVANVPNLYVRHDLLTPGPGTYELVSGCPLCDTTNTPLPPPGTTFPGRLLPFLAWASPDFQHVAFEVRQNLTPDAPAQPATCSATDTDFCVSRAYEWDDGVTRLAGILPDGRPADGSIIGHGAGANHAAARTVHTISDSSDGHTRVFFTQPTDPAGNSSSQLPDHSPQQHDVITSLSGNVFMRVDHSFSEQLNASERQGASSFAPAEFLDASSDGTRVFFMTSQALTDDAPLGGTKIYMYDATKPGADPHNLTLMTPAVGGLNADGLIGESDDGHYVYMIAHGQLVRGGPALDEGGFYLWHDGQISFIGPSPDGTAETEDLEFGDELFPQHSRVTPDGRHLLFSALSGDGLTGYDHGACQTTLGCREFYVYSADSSTPLQPDIACASCNPSGAPATQMASSIVRENSGGTQRSWHLNHAISSDGRFVFFSSAEALVPGDTNGKSDAYEYDVTNRTAHLLSSGTDPSDSWFLDASADGSDAFIITRERLVGWDTDGAYDIYDARINGGFPEPTPANACAGTGCQGLPAPPLPGITAASSTFTGKGNITATRPTHPRAARCKRGYVRRHVKGKGKTKCVKRKHRHAHKHPRIRPRR
jgi:hypothetical protein